VVQTSKMNNTDSVNPSRINKKRNKAWMTASFQKMEDFSP